MGKVIKLIDNMVVTLKQEQLDDDHKEEYCSEQFDFADDKKKGLEKTISDLETSITEAKDSITTLVEEIDALEDGIKALDKSVAEATEQRKEEHEDFTEEMSSNAAAKELLGFAKNRLNKFYNPKLYKPPAASFIQISKHEQLETSTEGKASSGKELMATEGYISSLHAECDWLLKYFDMRKEARANEIDALEKAKAVLSGADFSLVQTKVSHFLQRA